jgi:hypothetical protein
MMTIQELQAISESCETDAEFLITDAFWDVYQKCVGRSFPGSLADAVEAMRAKVAEKWLSDPEFQDRYVDGYDGMHTFDLIEEYVLAPAREWFVNYAEALGGCEIGGKENG